MPRLHCISPPGRGQLPRAHVQLLETHVILHAPQGHPVQQGRLLSPLPSLCSGSTCIPRLSLLPATIPTPCGPSSPAQAPPPPGSPPLLPPTSSPFLGSLSPPASRLFLTPHRPPSAHPGHVKMILMQISSPSCNALTKKPTFVETCFHYTEVDNQHHLLETVTVKINTRKTRHRLSLAKPTLSPVTAPKTCPSRKRGRREERPWCPAGPERQPAPETLPFPRSERLRDMRGTTVQTLGDHLGTHHPVAHFLT